MNKKILGMLLVLVIVLCGCEVTQDNLLDLVEDTVNTASLTKVASKVNMNKGFISYYLEPDVGRSISNRSSSVFLMYGNEVILNIDVSAVVSSKYYSANDELREIVAYPNQIYEKEGAFTTGTNLVRNFRYRLFEVDEEMYGIQLQTSNLVMIAEVARGDVLNVTEEMFLLIRTVRVDEEAIVSAYSQKELINYQKETLEVFETIYPESGTLGDMLNEIQE